MRQTKIRKSIQADLAVQLSHEDIALAWFLFVRPVPDQEGGSRLACARIVIPPQGISGFKIPRTGLRAG
jgi:hypothetical protein